MTLKHLTFSLMAIIIAGLACNVPSPDAAPTDQPTLAPTADVTSSTAETIDQPTTQPAEVEAIDETLRVALISEDFDALESLMGDAFLLQFTGGERGLITVNDAIELLRTDLLSGPNPIAFNAEIDPEVAFGTEINIPEIDLAPPLFSTEWGAENEDHAIVLIGRDASGSEYFAGLIYARQGFAGVRPTQVTSVTPTAAETPNENSPDPAPRGSIRYESDFLQGWPSFNDEHVTSQHNASGYLLSVVSTWGGWAFTSQIDVATYYAEIAVVPQECPESQGSYGLIFNHRDSDEFLVFVIECNGTFTLWERTATTRSQMLATDELPDGIEAQSGEHRLGVLTEGGNLALYIDDFRVATVNRAVSGGDFGPYVETSGSAAMSALFTNLSIYDTD